MSNVFVSVFYFVIYLSHMETRSVSSLYHEKFFSLKCQNNEQDFSENLRKLYSNLTFHLTQKCARALSEKTVNRSCLKFFK